MLLGALLGALLLASCSKEQPAGDTQEMLNNAEAQVSFVPQIESGAEVSEMHTKAVTTAPLATGTKVNIIALRKNGVDGYLSAVTVEKIYSNKNFTVGQNTLIPTDGKEFSMFKDTYTFIAISDNTTTGPDPVWKNKSGYGIAVDCEYGGVDYIGVCLTDQSIASNTKLSLSFKRLCAKLQLAISKDDATINTLQVTGVKTQVGYLSPDDKALLFYNGADVLIRPCTTIGSTLYPMVKGATDNEYSYILAPITWDVGTSSQAIEMIISANVTLVGGGSTSYAKDYKLKISKNMTPKIHGGKIYKYSAKISASGITFDGIPQVNDWPADGEITLDPSEN